MNIFSKTGGEQAYMKWWLARQKMRQNAALSIRGINLSVRKDVFSPDPEETCSSLWLLDNLSDLKGKVFLDIGTGCGLLSLHALYCGAAHIVTADIDADALANAKDNLSPHMAGRDISLIRSDLFQHIDGKFDTVAANLPIIDDAWPQIEEGTQNIYARFLRDLSAHLASDGEAWLSFASFGDTEGFSRLIAEQPLRAAVKKTEKFGVNWYAVKLTY